MDTIKQSSDFLLRGESVSQGDVTLQPISEIPGGIERQLPKNNQFIIAHSETGHNHAIDYVDGVDVYDQDEFISYLHNKTNNVIELKHHRNFDTHKPLGIPPGARIRIVRQREYTPEGFRRAID